MAQRTHPMVSIIIVTYNAPNYVRKCLESLRCHTEFPYEIVVVDNASEEPTKRLLRAMSLPKLIENHENRLWSPACNQGVAASDPSSPYLLLLNSDVEILRKGWLSRALTVMDSNPTVGLVGPEWICRSPDVLHWPIAGHLDGHFLLIRRKTWETCGPLDEQLPWWHADAVLALKAYLAGYILTYAPELNRFYIHHRARSVQESGKGEPRNPAFSYLQVLENLGVPPRPEEFWSKPLLRRFFSLPEIVSVLRCNWSGLSSIPNGIVVPFHPIPAWMELGLGSLGVLLFYMAGRKLVETGRTVSREEGPDSLVLVGTLLMERKGSPLQRLGWAQKMVRAWARTARPFLQRTLTRHLRVPVLWAPAYSFEASRRITVEQKRAEDIFNG